MPTNEIVAALRCAALTPSQRKDCTADCPFYAETITNFEGRELPWEDCDYDTLMLAAANCIEHLTKKG